MAMAQLALFGDVPSGVCCLLCGERLRDLNELRGRCPESGGIHEVTRSDYFVLYAMTAI